MASRDPASPKDAARTGREKRLAEALRANLRRRKSAARAAPAGEAAAPAAPTPETPPACGKDEEH